MGDLVTLFVTIMSNFCPESTPERKFIGSYTSGNRKARMEVGLAGTLTLKEKDQEVYFKISPYLNVLISADGSLFEFKASGKCTWDKAEWKRQATGESGANTDGVVGHLTQSVVTAHHEPQVQNKKTGPWGVRDVDFLFWRDTAYALAFVFCIPVQLQCVVRGFCGLVNGSCPSRGCAR